MNKENVKYFIAGLEESTEELRKIIKKLKSVNEMFII